jgi:hypothetical protein
MKNNAGMIGMLGVLLVMTFASTGCMPVIGSAMHSSAISRFPTYAETKMAWGAVPDGSCRVVMFYPKCSRFVPGGTGECNVGIRVDDRFQTGLADQTFVFLDLAPGHHQIKYVGGLMFGPAPFEFDLSVGEIKYVRLLARDRKLMNAAEAEPMLADVRHSYMKPIPFDKQEKSADSVLSHM